MRASTNLRASSCRLRPASVWALATIEGTCFGSRSSAALKSLSASSGRSCRAEMAPSERKPSGARGRERHVEAERDAVGRVAERGLELREGALGLPGGEQSTAEGNPRLDGVRQTLRDRSEQRHRRVGAAYPDVEIGELHRERDR